MRTLVLMLLMVITACREEPAEVKPPLPPVDPLSAAIQNVSLSAQSIDYSSIQNYSINDMEAGVANPEISTVISLRNNTGHEIRVPAHGHRLWLRQIEGFFSDVDMPDSPIRQFNDRPASALGCEDTTQCLLIPPRNTKSIMLRSKLAASTFGHLRDSSNKKGVFSLLLVIQEPNSSNAANLSERAVEIHKLEFVIPVAQIDKAKESPPDSSSN
jgi:hypothetical protein